MSEFDKRQIDKNELLPDGSLICSFVIPSNCATKKTNQSIIYAGGRPRIIQSKRYLEFEKFCKPFCESAWKNKGKVPMDFGVAIKIKVWRTTWGRIDQTGIYQSFGDIFQKWEIILDDRWINWMGTTSEHWFQGIDKENPRTEIFIYRHKHPYEDYREIHEVEEERLFEKRGGPRKVAIPKSKIAPAPKRRRRRLKKTK